MKEVFSLVAGRAGVQSEFLLVRWESEEPTKGSDAHDVFAGVQEVIKRPTGIRKRVRMGEEAKIS